MGFGHIERFSGSSRQFLSCKEYLEMNSSSKLLYSLLAFVSLSSSPLSFLVSLGYGDLSSSFFGTYENAFSRQLMVSFLLEHTQQAEAKDEEEAALKQAFRTLLLHPKDNCAREVSVLCERLIGEHRTDMYACS